MVIQPDSPAPDRAEAGLHRLRRCLAAVAREIGPMHRHGAPFGQIPARSAPDTTRLPGADSRDETGARTTRPGRVAPARSSNGPLARRMPVPIPARGQGRDPGCVAAWPLHPDPGTRRLGVLARWSGPPPRPARRDPDTMHRTAEPGHRDPLGRKKWWRSRMLGTGLAMNEGSVSGQGGTQPRRPSNS